MNLYVHFPFCLSKCRYCALYSVAAGGGDGIVADYPPLFGREYALRFAPAPASTVYFGGGTPSLLGADGLVRTADALRRAGVDFSDVREWTVELNPAPALVSPGLFAALRAMGANRLSFGVQSLDDAVLAAMGRRHSAADAAAAVALARRCGFDNVGIDLIAGFPGCGDATWRDTVARAAALDVRHVSVYGLIVEPGTPLAAAIADGRLPPPDDDCVMDALALAEDLLKAAGFVRYEISNYALPGCECLHNSACWRGEDYVGIGPAAASRVALARRTNAPDVAAWRAALAQGVLPPASNDEALSPAGDAEERFVYGLRTAEGVSPAEFVDRLPSARPLAAGWTAALERLAREGIAFEARPGRWRLTRRGFEVADSAIMELLT